MEKNVIVVDEQGNEYGATYPKRAKGLVKNGRARFVDENKICLACPPNEYLEDKEMSENTSANTQEQEIKVQEDKTDVSLKYILSEIKAIRGQMSHLDEALKMLDSVEHYGPGDIGAAEKSKAIADVVKCRETTNQQMLRFYERLYDDLDREKQNITPKEKVELVKSSFDNILAFISEINLDPEDRFASVGYVTEQVSNLISKIMTD